MSSNEPDESIKQHIKQQIDFNSGKNLLANDIKKSLQFIDGTESLINSLRNMDVESEELLINFLTDESLQEFCRVNQYFSFNSASVNELKTIYTNLNKKIKAIDSQAVQTSLDELSNEHYRNLCDWLVKTNTFAGQMYAENEEYAQPVACSEYAPDLQLDLLQIELQNLKEPILDVGCGREMNLVNYLRDNGFKAWGIDRFDNNNPYYIKSDWLEYNFEPGSWGTIISNLGFSNHFIHHNLRTDGNYREYAQKYMEILAALSNSGSFYYAPSLPFIEKHLNKQTYCCETFSIKNSEFNGSRISLR